MTAVTWPWETWRAVIAALRDKGLPSIYADLARSRTVGAVAALGPHRSGSKGPPHPTYGAKHPRTGSQVWLAAQHTSSPPKPPNPQQATSPRHPLPPGQNRRRQQRPVPGIPLGHQMPSVFSPQTMFGPDRGNRA
jgi:hypothetical protein